MIYNVKIDFTRLLKMLILRAIRDQAQAFREHIRGVLVFYMKRAIESNNTTLANRLREAGHSELVTLLEI